MRSLARDDRRVRRLMSAPGVGAVVALTFVAAIDDPARFRVEGGGGAFWRKRVLAMSARAQRQAMQRRRAP